ncbi:MAG: DUF1559 domain-containing protein [Armatimonadetes bacterium]|nr:DUF1559 domain-containing protein [Armatimonadota bacterium]
MNDSRLQRRGFTFWQVVLLLGTVGLLAAILFPIFGRSRNPGKRSSCQSNLKQISLGIKQYIQDYDARFPVIASGARANSGKVGDLSAFGWADAIQPYLKSTQIYQCFEESNGSNASYPNKADPTKTQYTDYWFNARLSHVRERQILEPAQTILLGDGNDGSDVTNARYHLMSIPEKWRGDENSPLYRHREGANFAFADGHVKGFPARSWKNSVSHHRGATFLLGSGKVTD